MDLISLLDNIMRDENAMSRLMLRDHSSHTHTHTHTHVYICAMGPDDVEEVYILLIVQKWPAAMHLELVNPSSHIGVPLFHLGVSRNVCPS